MITHDGALLVGVVDGFQLKTIRTRQVVAGLLGSAARVGTSGRGAA